MGSAEFEFHPERIVVGRGDSGATIMVETTHQIIAAAREHFGAPFGFISDRVNDYSADFKVYRAIDDSPDIQVMAVVAHRPMTQQVSGTECLMLKKTPFAAFPDLESAKAWVVEQMADK